MRQKNIFKKWLAGACLLAIASCAELTPVQNQTEENVSGQGTRIEVLGLRTETDTKVTLSGTTFAWHEGDTIAVWTGTSESNGKYQECIVAANGSLPVTLQEGESRFHYALYPASIRAKNSYTDATLRVILPDSYDYDLVCGDNVRTPMIAVNNNGSSNLVFYNLASMLRLTVTLPKRTVKLKIKFHSVNQDHLDRHISGEFIVGTSSEHVVVGTSCIRRSNQLAGGVDEMFITGIHDIPESDSTITVNIPIPIADDYNDFSVSAWDSEGKAIKAEIVHLATDYNATRAHGKIITTVLTQGTFAISDDKYCIISPANLMYDGTKEAGKRFVFHENEHDIISIDNQNYTEGGVIDRFPYGSSGANGINPWNKGSYYTNDLRDNNADWGYYNEISSYKKKTWCTPSSNDWKSFISNDYFQASASLDNVKGFILLPVNYSGPAVVKGMRLKIDNTYTSTADNWKQMKEAGAIFLPIDDNYANYWTGTHGNYSNEAFYFSNQIGGSGNDQYYLLGTGTDVSIKKASLSSRFSRVRLIHIL